MNNEVEELIEKAKKIISRTGNKPGTKYPKSLKNIVISLRLDHNMSVKDVIKLVPVSSYAIPANTFKLWASLNLFL